MTTLISKSGFNETLIPMFGDMEHCIEQRLSPVFGISEVRKGIV